MNKSLPKKDSDSDSSSDSDSVELEKLLYESDLSNDSVEEEEEKQELPKGKDDEDEATSPAGIALKGIVAEGIKKRRKRRYEKDADNGLSHAKMVSRMNKYHPRIKVDGKKKPYPVFGTSTGWFIPFERCRHWRRSDFYNMGVGVSLYFKFLKYIIFVLFCMSILSLPALIFFGLGSGEEKAGGGIYFYLAKTTLGNLGSARPVCSKLDNLDA